MATTKKPRKRYRPRPMFQDPLGYVVERLQPTTTASDWLTALKLRNHGALVALMQGEAVKAHVTDAIAAHNMCAALVHKGFGKEYFWVIQSSEVAIKSFCERYQRTGRYGLSGPEISAMKDLLDLHDQQMEITRIGDIEDAIAYAKGLIERGFTAHLSTKRFIKEETT